MNATTNSYVATATAWNEEILMPSMMQSSLATLDATAITDGSTWCSKMHHELTASEITVNAYAGFGGRTKCTFQFVAAADSMTAPAIKLTQAKTADFHLNYIEWYAAASLGTNAILPAAEGSAGYFIGAYPVAEGVFFNPLKTDSSSIKGVVP